MAHFAKIQDGIVTQVIVAEQGFVNALGGQWVQTSYNTRGGVHYDPATGAPSSDQSKALRKNYAGIGFTYDAQRDAFIPPKAYPSWTLNEQTCLWEPPVPVPQDGNVYVWDEGSAFWVLAEQSEEA